MLHYGGLQHFLSCIALWGLVLRRMKDFCGKALKALPSISPLKVVILVVKGQKHNGPTGKIDDLQAKNLQILFF